MKGVDTEAFKKGCHWRLVPQRIARSLLDKPAVTPDAAAWPSSSSRELGHHAADDPTRVERNGSHETSTLCLVGGRHPGRPERLLCRPRRLLCRRRSVRRMLWAMQRLPGNLPKLRLLRRGMWPRLLRIELLRAGMRIVCSPRVPTGSDGRRGRLSVLQQPRAARLSRPQPAKHRPVTPRFKLSDLPRPETFLQRFRSGHFLGASPTLLGITDPLRNPTPSNPRRSRSLGRSLGRCRGRSGRLRFVGD